MKVKTNLQIKSHVQNQKALVLEGDITAKTKKVKQNQQNNNQ